MSEFQPIPESDRKDFIARLTERIAKGRTSPRDLFGLDLVILSAAGKRVTIGDTSQFMAKGFDWNTMQSHHVLYLEGNPDFGQGLLHGINDLVEGTIDQWHLNSTYTLTNILSAPPRRRFQVYSVNRGRQLLLPERVAFAQQSLSAFAIKLGDLHLNPAFAAAIQRLEAEEEAIPPSFF